MSTFNNNIETIKTLKSIEEFKECIEEVKKTKEIMRVRHEYKLPKGYIPYLNLKGVLTRWCDTYEEIIPL